VALLLSSALLACNPAEPVADDPYRIEFVAACEGRIEYRTMQAEERTAYCECGYDKTMAGLSDEEKPFARFYLLEQVGVDVQSRNLISEPNMQAMVKASEAIGKAVARCK
jgi:hypothetical protein